jgi:hypothetical protein
MMRFALFAAALSVACAAHAQTECRTDPQSPDLEFVPHPGARTLEFRGKRPDRGLSGVCVLTLDCTLRGLPKLVDYFILPQRAGDPPAVWNIRSVRIAFEEGGEQRCNVTATSEPRPPLAEPPPFIRRPKKN